MYFYKSKSTLSTYTEKGFSMNLEGNRRWVALKFCQFVVSSLNGGSTVLSYFPSRSFWTTIMNSSLVFLKNDIKGKKVLSRSLKCYPSLSPTPKGPQPVSGWGKEMHNISD